MPTPAPASQRREVILHAHIFKNAGSTLDGALRRQFGNGFVDHRDDEAMRAGGASYLYDLLNARPEILALSSHHMPLPINDHDDIRFSRLIFLRHPIERAESVYLFERTQGAKTPGSQFARRHSFTDYIEWRLSTAVGRTLSNHQTRICSGYRGPDITRDHLAIAENYVHQHCHAGIVDRFDESMVLFEAHLQTRFSDIDLSYQSRNVNRPTAQTLTMAARVDSCLQHAGSQAEALLAANQLDLELYTRVNDALDIRLQALPARDEKLKDLQHRKQSLQPDRKLLKRLLKTLRRK